MKISKVWGVIFLIGGMVAVEAVPGFAQVDPLRRCLLCHGKAGFKEVLEGGKERPLYIDVEDFRGSAHGNMVCTICHTDVRTIPHLSRPRRIHCLQCHYEGNVVGAPVERKPEKYKESVHGKALEKGDPRAPDCRDCHTSHSVRQASDSASTVNKRHVPETCGRCHLSVFTAYSQSVHGTALSKGILESAACSDCHREHDLLPKDDPRSSLYPQNVANTCATCHQNETLMRKLGIPVKQVQAFKESFHGVAIEFGFLKVANCVSCHGYHDILPQSDIRSSIHPTNLAKTCGKCHPRVTAMVARGKIHVLPTEPSSGIVYWVSQFFKWFTILVLLGLFLHILLDLFGRFRAHRTT